MLIEPHYFLKITILLFTSVQTVPFRKIDTQKIFEIQQDLGNPFGTLHESF